MSNQPVSARVTRYRLIVVSITPQLSFVDTVNMAWFSLALAAVSRYTTAVFTVIVGLIVSKTVTLKVV